MASGGLLEWTFAMTRHAIFLAVAITISMGMSSSLTNAKGRLDHFGPATIEGPSMMGPGKWRSKIQLIFDPTSRQLVRRRYEVWDPQPHLNLDFHWQPAETDTHTPGRVNGRGHLIWRKPGQPSYDRTAIVSEYQGSMRDGRPHGHGRYLERNGLYYEGGRPHGRKPGSGSIKKPNRHT